MRNTFDKHAIIIAAFTITVVPVIIYHGGGMSHNFPTVL